MLFLISIIYSRKLSFEEYGTFQSVWMYVNILGVVLSFGLSSVILSTNINFLFSFIRSNQKRMGLFYSLLWIAGLIIFYFFAKNFSHLTKIWLIIFIIIQNISTVAETLLIKKDGEKISFNINFFYSILFLAWHLFVLQTTYSLSFLITGICALTFIKFILMAIIPVRVKYSFSAITQKSFLSHWSFLGLNDILGVVSKWVDKFFLLYLLTATDFAIFFNGSFEIPLFGLLISVIGSFLSIEISKNLMNTSKIINLYRQSFLILSALVFPLFFFLFFFREELFSLIFQNKYNASLPIFVISIFILPLRINNYSVILQCFSKGNKILLGSLLDVSLAIILMFTLYPFYGTRGIALAVVIATFCQIIFYLFQSAKALNTSVLKILPFKQLTIRFVITGVFYLILFLFVGKLNQELKLGIAIAGTCLFLFIGSKKYLHLFLKNHHEQAELKYKR